MSQKPTSLPAAPAPARTAAPASPLQPRSLPLTATTAATAAPAAGRQPTALPAGAPPFAPAPSLAPSPQAAPHPTALSVSLVKASAPAQPRQPTRIAGAALAGPELPLAVWQQRFPGERLERLEAAQARLRGGVVPRSTPQAARWGADSQAAHGALAERSLALGSAPALRDTQLHLQRLQTLLHTLAQAMQRSLDGGMLARLQDSVWDKLRRHQDEVLWLRGQLRELLPALEHNSLQWQALAAEAGQTEQDLAALGLAATLLAEQPGTPLDTQHALAGRAISLEQSSAGLLQAQLLASQRGADSLALLALVQDAVLLQLPQCLDQLQALQHDAALTPSKMVGLNTRLQDLVRRFG